MRTRMWIFTFFDIQPGRAAAIFKKNIKAPMVKND